MTIDEKIKVMCDLIALWDIEHGQDQTYYDAIAIRCDLIAKSAVPVHHYRNGFLDLIYCGGCSAIVTKGDKFCNQCGRRLTDND